MPDRAQLLRGQTPQAFYYRDIIDAYLNPVISDIPPTDDIRLMYNKKLPCKCVDGSEFNIKITTLSDLYLAERISQSLNNASAEHVDLTGKKCLVVGGTGGIGKAIIEVFEEQGAKVISVGSQDLDLREFDKYEEFFRKIRSEFGMVDILVNAAGILIKRPLINMDFDSIDKMLDINLKAPIVLTRCAIRTLMKKGGRIFHIGSSSWSRGRQEYAVYSASKAALVNFIQAMSEELATLDIKINCVNPPRTNTPMRRKAFGRRHNDARILRTLQKNWQIL
jgi:2-C-methyl-D-erythritol 4-phosphate cytidylyltransferase